MLLNESYGAHLTNEETDLLTELHMHNTQVYSFFWHLHMRQLL